MRSLRMCLAGSVAAFFVALLSGVVNAQSGLVCGNPRDKGCKPQYRGFSANDIAFLTGRAQLGTGTRHESAEFYAVILESVKAVSNKNRRGCLYIDETKRVSVQKLFPTSKVFTSRNSCVGTVITYGGVDSEYNFMAIYGGDEPAAIRIKARAQRKYPSAQIRRMSVVLDFADE